VLARVTAARVRELVHCGVSTHACVHACKQGRCCTTGELWPFVHFCECVRVRIMHDPAWPRILVMAVCVHIHAFDIDDRVCCDGSASHPALVRLHDALTTMVGVASQRPPIRA